MPRNIKLSLCSSDTTAADYPTTTRWLSEREKQLAVARLASRVDDTQGLTHKQAFVASMKDVKTWVRMA